MAPHSSTLAWRIPSTEEPGRLQSMGLWRVGHDDWVTSLSLFTCMHWRRKWQPTPVSWPGESLGREPGGLPSMGSHRVRYDWCDLAAAAGTSYKWNIQHLSFCVWQFHPAHKHLLGLFSLCSSQKFCDVILHYYADVIVVVWFGFLRLEQHKLYWMAKEWRSRNLSSNHNTRLRCYFGFVPFSQLSLSCLRFYKKFLTGAIRFN